jgi:hypothetical protein
VFRPGDVHVPAGVWVGGVVTRCDVLACGDGGRVAEEAARMRSALVDTEIKEIGRLSSGVESDLPGHQTTQHERSIGCVFEITIPGPPKLWPKGTDLIFCRSQLRGNINGIPT